MFIAAVLICSVQDPNMCGYKTSPMFFIEEAACYDSALQVAPSLIEDLTKTFLADIKCFKFDYSPPGPKA